MQKRIILYLVQAFAYQNDLPLKTSFPRQGLKNHVFIHYNISPQQLQWVKSSPLSDYMFYSSIQFSVG